MLNQYLAYELLFEETMRRSYLLENVEKDTDWKNGPLIVPFKGNSATSYSMGALTPQNDISEYGYVRGTVNNYKQIFGAMKWNQDDLIEHDAVGGQSEGVVSEQSFLKIFPDQLEDFVMGMKDLVSINLLSGAHFASLTADALANTGVITVDRPERFELNQKVYLQSGVTANNANITGYVRTIDINSNQVTLYSAKTGGSPLDFATNNLFVADGAKCFFQGGTSTANAFTSLRAQLLPAAAGGTSTLFGQSKLAYPYLQAIASSGATISATNILEKIFDHWTRTMQLGKGHATDVVMSYKHIGSVMKQLEAGAGAYRHVSTKATVYGYTEIVVMGVKGQLKLVAVHEMDDDVIYFIDWRALKLHSNGFFRKIVDPEGKGYYTVRDDVNGYQYICDIAFYGELVVFRPSHCGVLYGISY
jgi:hypothetical protein